MPAAKKYPAGRIELRNRRNGALNPPVYGCINEHGTSQYSENMLFFSFLFFFIMPVVCTVTETFSGHECKSKHQFCKLFNKSSGELRYVDGRHAGLTVDEAYEIEQATTEPTPGVLPALPCMTGVLEPLPVPAQAFGVEEELRAQAHFSDHVALQEQLQELGVFVPGSQAQTTVHPQLATVWLFQLWGWSPPTTNSYTQNC